MEVHGKVLEELAARRNLGHKLNVRCQGLEMSLFWGTETYFNLRG
jgi:hypothetical protein